MNATQQNQIRQRLAETRRALRQLDTSPLGADIDAEIARRNEERETLVQRLRTLEAMAEGEIVRTRQGQRDALMAERLVLAEQQAADEIAAFDAAPGHARTCERLLAEFVARANVLPHADPQFTAVIKALEAVRAPVSRVVSLERSAQEKRRYWERELDAMRNPQPVDVDPEDELNASTATDGRGRGWRVTA